MSQRVKNLDPDPGGRYPRGMQKKSLLAAVVALALPAVASAASVFLNGQNITGITNTKFENCSVSIDAQGNVFIEAKGYSVQTTAAPAPSAPVGPPPSVITKRYFMVTEQSERGAAQYDIDLYINAKWVRKMRSDDEQIVLDVTKYLRPGPNKVVLSAAKNIGGGRRSMSPAAKYTVIIGEGNEGGGQVMIDNPVIEYSKSAAEMDNSSQEYTLQAH